MLISNLVFEDSLEMRIQSADFDSRVNSAVNLSWKVLSPCWLKSRSVSTQPISSTEKLAPLSG